MMTRSFLPVGQGAFYAERFELDSDRVNVIYDCGSSTGIHIVEQAIRNHFYQGEEVNGVFISHFDADHTNGLPYLLKYCHVKNLFFPLITKELQEFVSLDDLIHPSQNRAFLSAFVKDPLGALEALDLDYHPALYQIQENGEYDDSRSRRIDVDAISVPSGENVSHILFSPRHKNPDWLYIPFNFREIARIKAFKAAMQSQLGCIYSCADLLDLLDRGVLTIDDIKQVYKTVPGSLNTNSMTVLSASPDSSIMQSLSKFPLPKGYCPHCSNGCTPCIPCIWKFPNGCLYTGDYDAKGPQKWNELYSAYRKYDAFIGCVQIPHHGSKHNYNPQLLGVGHCLFYIISAGSKHRPRHPHSSVVRDIISHYRYPFIVTENSGAVRFDIS